MDRGEDVVLSNLFGEQDGVLEVVAVPGHERDEHVAAQGQVAQFGRGTVSDDVAGLNVVADNDQRALVDAGRLVRTLELHQIVDVDARLGGIGFFRCADDDTGRIHLVYDTGAQRGDRRTRV